MSVAFDIQRLGLDLGLDHAFFGLGLGLVLVSDLN